MSQELITTGSREMQQVQKRLIEIGMPESEAMKELSFAAQLVNTTPILQQCDRNSLLSAIVNVGNVGLTLNPAARESYLVPRYNRKRGGYEASLMPSYIGLIKLIVQEGSVTSIVAQLVYENDKFSIDLADNRQPVKHNPELVKSRRGDFIGAYALATMSNGQRQVEWMDREEIELVRGTSESYSNEKTQQYSPWVKHFGEMARKTVVKRLTKYLPRGYGQSHAREIIDCAIATDNEDAGASFNQISYINNLLRSCTLSPERQDQIEREMHGYTFQEAKDAIDLLLDSQSEPIDPAKQFKARMK